jgi:Flp pilus assembly protein TadG
MRKPSPRARHGAAVVEFAILLPFLVGLFLFAIDFARILYYTITLENCIHNGALFGSQAFDNQNQQWVGGGQYWQSPSGALVSQEDVATQLDGTNLSPALQGSQIQISSNQKDADGNLVNIVTISYTFTTFVSWPGLPSPVTISRTAQVRVAPATPS